jgi:DNA-binding CsgD family transcriptional regulator
MSNGGENPISENPAVCPALGENGPLATCPAAGVDAEGHAADAAQRPSKADRMAEIARLSAEGDSNRTIARKLGVPRQTVDRSMRKFRRRRCLRLNHAGKVSQNRAKSEPRLGQKWAKSGPKVSQK